MCVGGKGENEEKRTSLKIIMRNLESEVLSWLNPDSDKLKSHVVHIQLSASCRSNSL